MAHVPDPADEWLKADARRRGKSLSEYEQEHSIMFERGPAEQRVNHHELTAGLVSDDDVALARRFERQHQNHYPKNSRRQRARPIRKAGRFASAA